MDNISIDLDQIIAKIQSLGVDFGVRLLTAIVIFYIGRLLIKVVMSAVKKLMQRIDMDPTLQVFLSNILKTALLAFVVLAALAQLGVETTSVIAVLGAAGLAVGLALQGSLANFAAGVLIIIFRPYRVGDYIEAAGVGGTVEAVSIFNTIMKSPDNRMIVVPNANITSGAITNFSAHDTRRIDLIIGVSYEDDLKKTTAVIMDVLTSESRVLTEPAPLVAVAELGDSSINFNVRPWVATADYWATRYALLQAIKERLDAENISIPFPQRDVHLYSQKAD